MTPPRRALALALALALFALAPARAWAVPRITSAVTDEAGAVPPAAREELSQRLQGVYAAGGPQVAVLYVRDTGGLSIEEFSLQVARAWRGGHAGRDDGVLITFALGAHRSRIEVGAGLRDEITDDEARDILEDVRPEMRSGRFALAGWRAADAVIVAAGGTSAPPGPAVLAAAAASGAAGAAGKAGAGGAEPAAADDGAWVCPCFSIALGVMIIFVTVLVAAIRRRGPFAACAPRAGWPPAAVPPYPMGYNGPPLPSPPDRGLLAAISSFFGSFGGSGASPPADASSWPSSNDNNTSSTWSDSSSSSSSSSSDSSSSSYDGGGGSFGGGGGSSDW